ncbi:uncharacterized protein LOC124298157 isoform X1 [Neodiprion virginianus]|uniref:uncharacterized protein LOC124298157 isoform X1 n=2 Tax=Neodiprion virginianus TaxID=2961670 RepID=UPI001EE6A756|nr:uncharacterized protein LOC124298157 isoform X1 [Neodiprion virginianus]XP_046605774.1 uncharacterized protein LOC124298157 isoform X1 [Neodiprion virginianus]XP_046605775.1 uncharacterized protein LOC124298157 isoform X1 [Neodiprion virginianus]XP_046605776.1 uncharacterized protein LOC124298157 isoform X1 [Neodiprion virginianus]
MRAKREHIDNVQPATVDKHFDALINDEETIDYDPSEDLTPTDFPEWYDEKLFKAGKDYYDSNMVGLTAASLAGLISVLSIPTILKVLIYTKQSGTSCTAFKRYFETVLHSRAWYMDDATTKGSDWFRSLNVVRWKHMISSRRSSRDGFGGIMQRDMAYTQFGFLGYVLIEPEYLGLTNTPEEREGINHFWRVLGHMLGISDRLNICRKTEAETTQLCRRLQTEVFAKYFKELPPNFLHMAEVMVDGLWVIDTTLNTDTVFAVAYRLNGLTYHKPLSTWSWLNLKYRELIYTLLGSSIFGPVLRVYFKHLLAFQYWMTLNFPIVAWIRYGKEESKINPYPKFK